MDRSKTTNIDWDAVFALYCECRSYKKAAEHFGVTVSAVKSRAKRGQWSKFADACAHSEGANSGGVTSLEGANPGVSSAPQEATPGGETGQEGADPGGKGAGSEGALDPAPAPSTDPAIPRIPERINSWSKLECARFYVERLGWAIHPLFGPKQGSGNRRGKRPLSEDWKRHRREDATPEFLARYFGGKKDFNLGCVITDDFVHVDLDSKDDAGASVDQWLAGVPSLATVPRERTGGGVHLAFRCRDLPESVQLSGSPLVHKINEAITAELFIAGMTLVVSPSVHASGHRYHWEVGGEIPLVTWSDLVAWFGFREGGDGSDGTIEAKRKKRDRSWMSHWKEDLRSFNLVAALDEAGLLGECLDPDTHKWAVACPWREFHSGDEPFSPDSGTVIFNPPERLPAFKCLHAHCAERAFKDVADWLERRFPGLVGAHCSRLRQWETGQQHLDGRPRILLPGLGRPDSEFATEMGVCIGPRQQWFRKGNMICTVGVREISEKVTALVFSAVPPVEAITAAERFAELGVLRKNEEGENEFVPVSMKRECASMLMAAPHFREQLPAIVRILDVRLPIRYGNEIVFPESGYDPRFRSYCPPDAPEPEPMGLAQAKGVLHEVHAEFCWKDLQSLTHAIARLLTPFCRGLMGWDARFPLWHYAANRPRAGKDYLAVIPGYLYQGWLSEDAPLDRDTEETRKRITAALMSGRRNIHFANCQGFIQDPHFIGAITSKTFSARNLGSTDARADLILPNEIEFSLSANVGLTFREDIEPRTRRIALEFFDENPNSRHFSKPDLHGWVLTHRPRIIGAVAALVQHWISKGCPPGPTPFNSFPEWARIVGGIMVACDLGDPCLPHDHQNEIGGDRQESAMRAIFRIGHENHPEEWIEKSQLFELIEAASEDEALAFFCREGDLGSRSAKVRIGQTLRQFRGRQLDGIQLQIESNSKSQRQRVKFAQPAAPERVDIGRLLGQVGHIGHINALQKLIEPAKGKAPSGEPEVDGGNTEQEGAQPAQHAQHAHVSRTPREARLITSREDIDRVVDDLVLSGTGRIALDLETCGDRKGDTLNPWRGAIRLLTVCREDGPIWILDLRAISYDLGPLAAILKTATLVIHNAKFDLLWLRVKCGLDCRRVWCTLTAARLLTAGTRPGNNLDECLKRHLGIEPGPDHSRSDWGSPLLTPDQFAYASRDVAHLHELADALERELESQGLAEVWELERALLPCVIDMEIAGIAVDRVRLETVAAKQRDFASESAEVFRTEVGDPKLNLSSPGQLLAVLRSAGLDLKSTREEDLKAADDGKLVPLILRYRTAEKQVQQAETLLEHIADDGRIHARFEPTGTATGRFSSKEPNLQNIGRGELREAFVAAPGHRLIVADYSQIELRAAAAIAGETKMIEAYRAGQDLHKLTASTVLGADPASISKEQRQTAKAVSFGLLYGQSAPGLVRYAESSYGVTMEIEEARRIRAGFFRTYGHLRQWHGVSHQKAEQGIREVRTRLGRRRLIPEGASEWDRFTALVNTPVQGGCADGMKQAIVLIAERLPESAHILSTVHDEVIVEAPEADAEVVRDLVINTMREAMAGLFPEVPIEVEGGVCSNWGEKG